MKQSCLRHNASGFALIAVLVALAILLALVVPFLDSMIHESREVERDMAQLRAAQASQSTREFLLHQAAESHLAVDQDRWADGRSEYPDSLDMPASLRSKGKVLTGGSVQDLQRQINLNSASPLLLSNLLGLVAHLRGDHPADSLSLTLSAAANFPQDGGSLLVDGEVIHYSRREGVEFQSLQWEVEAHQEEHQGFADGSLVLDYRVVQAVTFPFQEPTKRKPFSSVAELQRLQVFSPAEMDVLLAHCTVHSTRQWAQDWGRGERLFNQLIAGETKVLRTSTAAGMGGGMVVRIRSQDGRQEEYAFVHAARAPTSRLGTVNLASRWELRLLQPVQQDFAELTTVVEPLLPHPINLNTAGPEVLQAMLLNLRQAARRPRLADEEGRVRFKFGQHVDSSMSRSLTQEILRLRDEQSFFSWEDLCQRLLQPQAEIAQGQEDKQQFLLILLNMLYGRDINMEMGTAPVVFTSSSMVSYRAAALAHALSGRERARQERTGIASAQPGQTLDMILSAQKQWEESYRLGHRAPHYLSFPNHLGAAQTDRLAAYLMPSIAPEAGFGQARYPHLEREGSGIRAATAIEDRGAVATQIRVHESFPYALDPDGRDLDKEGAYELLNSVGAEPVTGGRPNDPLRFPLTSGNLPRRHASSFWLEPEDLGDQCFFDQAGELTERNRINLRFSEGDLLLEVLDEAGLDPDPASVTTSPERTAAQWPVNLSEMGMQANVPLHVNFAVTGNRPEQLSLLVDGVPRHEPRFRTYLARDLPQYQRPNLSGSILDDRNAYPDILVESTEHFPEQGVLRIGRELFEYTSKGDGSFHCKYLMGSAGSFGGRKARMDWAEFREDIPLDDQGRPTVNAQNVTGASNLDLLPAHPAGLAVELYGYSAPLYRNTPLTVGSASLTEAMGAFALARAIPSQPVGIILAGQSISFNLGRGLDEAYNGEIELADPLPDVSGKGFPPAAAQEELLRGFPAGGGFALLVQKHLSRVEAVDPNESAEPLLDVGGLELIRYQSRKGAVLSGIQRGVRLNGMQDLPGRGLMSPDGAARKFVADWNGDVMVQVDGTATAARELPSYVLYIVPVSLPVTGAGITDPTILPQTDSEWLQIYPGPGREQDTEWVRYNFIDGNHVLRATSGAWSSLHRALTAQAADIQASLRNGSGSSDELLAAALVYDPPFDDGLDRIGYIEDLETQFPMIYQARRALKFRGDPFTNTASHAQVAGALVLPCHRMELDWGNLGALGARSGRLDRVALVGGVVDEQNSQRPSLEWQQINWVVQRQGFDTAGAERLGPAPFQLLAFKNQVTNIFVGPAERNDFVDTRQVDRLVKFPSGELPAASVTAAWFGSANPSLTDYTDARGLVDEVDVASIPQEPLVLAVEMSAAAEEFTVAPNLRLFPYGPLQTNNDMTQLLPTAGGLVDIDGEIIAYQSHEDGRFQVADQGRGMLGTEVRAHGRGARLQFLSHVPAAILSAGASELDARLVVQELGALPPFGGTVLLGNEMLHYTWTVSGGDQGAMLEMPQWHDPERPDLSGRGLFRGRYGTRAQAGGSGQALVWFPFRFWDRFHERSDDPELAYCQATLHEPRVYFRSLQWLEENPAPSFLDLHCYVRVDGQASFADDPEQAYGLFRLQQGNKEGQPNWLGWQGSTLEARFVTLYKEGAFDPLTFSAHAWKQSPMVRDAVLRYEGETHILQERITAR